MQSIEGAGVKISVAQEERTEESAGKQSVAASDVKISVANTIVDKTAVSLEKTESDRIPFEGFATSAIGFR